MMNFRVRNLDNTNTNNKNNNNIIIIIIIIITLSLGILCRYNDDAELQMQTNHFKLNNMSKIMIE